MKRGNRDASHWNYHLRIALVLLTLTALVVLGGCGLRGHDSTNNSSGQQTTGQQTGGSQTGQNNGSNSAAQQVQDADQQVQDAMQGVDSAQNDADNANNQAGQENDLVP